MEKCQGLKGNNGDCCHIRDKNWIIGKVKDDKELLERVQKEYDENLTWNDLFIDYEEGSKMFPDKPDWQNKDLYPMRGSDQNLKEVLVCSLIMVARYTR